MTPKPNYPYNCPLLLSTDDVTALRNAGISLAQIETMLSNVQSLTEDNQHTLRGHNGDDGMIARLTRLEGIVSNIVEVMEPVKELAEQMKSVKNTVEQLKDVPKQIEAFSRYPSLTWLVHHKLREMAIVTAAIILLAVFIGFPGTYLAERLQIMIEILFAKWLRL